MNKSFSDKIKTLWVEFKNFLSTQFSEQKAEELMEILEATPDTLAMELVKELGFEEPETLAQKRAEVVVLMRADDENRVEKFGEYIDKLHDHENSYSDHTADVWLKRQIALNLLVVLTKEQWGRFESADESWEDLFEQTRDSQFPDTVQKLKLLSDKFKTIRK